MHGVCAGTPVTFGIGEDGELFVHTISPSALGHDEQMRCRFLPLPIAALMGDGGTTTRSKVGCAGCGTCSARCGMRGGPCPARRSASPRAQSAHRLIGLRRTRVLFRNALLHIGAGCSFMRMWADVKASGLIGGRRRRRPVASRSAACSRSRLLVFWRRLMPDAW